MPAARPTPSRTTPTRSLSPAPESAMAPYSRSPIAATINISAPNPHGWFQRISAPTSGNATTAEIRRCARLGSATGACLSGAANLLARAAEATLATAVGLERFVELGLPERRPEGVREVQLGVGRLPEQEVRQPFFARRPHQQVQLRQPAGLQRRLEVLLVDLVEADLAARDVLAQGAGRGDDRFAAAIGQREA